MKQIDSALAMNKEGVAYFVQNEFEKAVHAFQLAIDLQPDYTDAYYNLGLALNKLERRQEAKNAYEALITLSPEHVGARFQLGCLWMHLGQFHRAIEHFSVIERVMPAHAETLMNLATCHLKLGHLNEAKSLYLKVLELMPDEKQAHFNLGVISMQQGRPHEAITFYLQAIKLDANYYDAHHNLAAAYLSLNDRPTALLHFKAALSLHAHDEAVRHTVAILSQDKHLSDSPPAYIRSLFDSYAGHYDQHLTATLHYQVPQLLLQMVLTFNPKATQLDMLDLGCGSGLTGQLFKPYAQKLVGVDLSKNMLALAEQKAIYDQLHETDMISYLTESQDEFDLVLAGDVFVYTGDLAKLFSLISCRLKPGGLLAFNTEISDKETYQMTQSGRFAHYKGYIDQLAQDNQMQVLTYHVAVMRAQEGVDVPGHFYLLQRLC